MRSLIFILIIFISFLSAGNFIAYLPDYKSLRTGSSFNINCKPGDDVDKYASEDDSFCYNGVIYKANISIDYYNDSSHHYNSQCLYKNYSYVNIKAYSIYSNGNKYIVSNTLKDYGLFFFDDTSFCENKDGYKYDEKTNAWYPTDGNGSVICPDGQVYDSKQEKCVKKKTCDDYKNECSSKCGGLNNVKNFTCSTDSNGNVNYTCECASCNDLVKLAIQNCSSKDMKVGTFTCSDKNGYITSSTSTYLSLTGGDTSFCIAPDDNSSQISVNDENITCSVDEDIVIDANGNVSCVKHNSNDNDDNSNDNSDTDNQNDNSSGDNTDDNNSSNDNSNKCDINLCDRYKNPAVGDNWSQDGNCWIWLNAPQNCPNKICIEDGKCIIPNANSDSNNSNSLNIDKLVEQQKITNDKLTSINKTLEDIKNLKPDGNFTLNPNLSDDFLSFIDTYKDFVSNSLQNIEDIKSSIENVKSVFVVDRYKLKFNSNQYQCPLDFNFHGKVLSVDICSFISPYRPLLVTFFTFLLSLKVVLYFIRIVVYFREKLF